MTLIQSRLKPSSESFRQNHAHNLALCEALREQKEILKQGGGPKAMARHRDQGKLFVRDRIAAPQARAGVCPVEGAGPRAATRRGLRPSRIRTAAC